MEIYILRGNQQSGPFPEEMVKSMLQAGMVQLADLAWHEELTEWKPLHAVLGISPTVQAQPPAGFRFPDVLFEPLERRAWAAVKKAYADGFFGDLIAPLRGKSRVHSGCPASFISRLCAGAIDSMLILFVVLFGWVLLGCYYAGKDFDQNSDPTWQEVLGPHMIAVCLIPILVIWLYVAMFEGLLTQATLGKIALGLVVTDLNGERVTFGRASKRGFGMVLSAFTLGIGFLMCAWAPRRQCLHDSLSGCLVLRRK